MSEWEQIISNGTTSIIEILDGKDEKSILLRSSSPFAGFLSNKERMRVIREKRKKPLLISSPLILQGLNRDFYHVLKPISGYID